MKRVLSALTAGILLLAAGAFPALAQGNWTDGIYEGAGQGYVGAIRVSVEISGGEMTAIEILETNETNMAPPMDFWAKAHPEMVNRILEAQSTEVDVVSGATYACHGIAQAVNDALGKASGEPVEEDGVFEKTVTALNRHNEDAADAPMSEMLQRDAIVERISGKYYATISFGPGHYGWSELDGSSITRVRALAANGTSYLDSTASQLDPETGIQSFTVPITTMEGQLIQVDCSYALVGMRNMRLYFTDRQPETVDKSALSQAIAEAEALEEEAYTPESWALLSQALVAARLVNGGADATNAMVEQALQELRSARESLVRKLENDGYSMSFELRNSWNGAPSPVAALVYPVAAVEVRDNQTYVTLRFVPGVYEEYEVDGNYITAVRAGGKPGERGLTDEPAGVRDFTLPVSGGAGPIALEIDSPLFLDGTVNVQLALKERMEEPPADRSTLAALVYQAKLLHKAFYTQESFAALSNCLSSAQAALDDGSASQAMLDTEDASLRTALTALQTTGEPVSVNTMQNLRLLAKAAPDGAVLQLASSMEADGTDRIISRHDITVMGGGHTLDGKNKAGMFYVQGGVLTLKQLSIVNAKHAPDGLYNGKGSAVLAENGDVRMENCTVLHTMSSWGSVYVDAGQKAEVIHCTFAGNTATGGASLCLNDGAAGMVANSIMVGGASASEIYVTGTPALMDGGYNLVTSIHTQSGPFPGATTVVDNSFYGGYTEWLVAAAAYDPAKKGLPLLRVKNNPALDAVPADSATLLDIDQAGTPRPQGARGDIGACELPAESIAPESVKIASPAFTTAKKGQTLLLEASVAPEAAADATLAWKSSNQAVASVDEKGLVTTLKAGITTITVSTENGKTHTITLRVTA